MGIRSVIKGGAKSAVKVGIATIVAGPAGAAFALCMETAKAVVDDEGKETLEVFDTFTSGLSGGVGKPGK